MPLQAWSAYIQNKKIENDKRKETSARQRVLNASDRILANKDSSFTRLSNESKSVGRSSRVQSPSRFSAAAKAKPSIEGKPRMNEASISNQSELRGVDNSSASGSGKKKSDDSSGGVVPERRQKLNYTFARCPQKAPKKGNLTDQYVRKPPKKVQSSGGDVTRIDGPRKSKQGTTKKSSISAKKKLSLTEPHTPQLMTMKYVWHKRKSLGKKSQTG